ncbi:MAG: endolytic transglycosylase MltG [Flavobacteriaceae bacterium]
MNKKRTFLLLFIGVIIVFGTIALTYYNKIYATNTTQETTIYIPSNSDFDEVLEILSPILENKTGFIWVANKKNYPNTIKAGKYQLKKGMNNNNLVNLLRSGNQVTVKLSFNNQDTLEKLASRIAEQLEPDSTSILIALTDEVFLSKNNIKREDVLGMYIPNSYDFYWNTSANDFRNKMLKEFYSFWTPVKKEQAKKQGLTVNEVITLASIVQKETASITERPRVAGLYLNRLNNKWPLQADPTIIFAIKQQQGQKTVIKRVLFKDLEVDSKYNTYKYLGLPPGPISMPDISSINAVLNPENHNYFYMCADVENLGKHAFAKTLAQHNRNAAKYQHWISKQGINR